MTVKTRLKPGEALGDRIMKVVHAGEHGAVNIYRGQAIGARLSRPKLIAELDDFRTHETRHRMIFEAELRRRGRPRCRTYHLCGLGGLLLGLVTGVMGERAIAATTVAVERVVLSHLSAYRDALELVDPAGFDALSQILADEQAHHDMFLWRTGRSNWLLSALDGLVAGSTEAVIWMGMRL
jgi:ubiquinone biosynthesis monooxygenase Coq7